MTQTDAPVGLPSGGRPINLSQLEGELNAQGVAPDGLGMTEEWVYPYDENGAPTDFTPEETPIVQAAINAHVGMRDKTDAELAEEFQDPNTTPARKQEIRDEQAGLIPREQVPMEATP